MMDWMAVLMFGLLGKGRALEEEDKESLGEECLWFGVAG